MTSPTPPGERPAARSLLPALSLTVVLAGLAVASAVVVAPDSVRVPLALGGSAAALLLCAAVAVAVHGVLATRAARRQLESVTQDVGRLLQERARIAEDARKERLRLTDEMDRERARLTAELAQERTRLTEALNTECARLAEEHEAERARLADEYTAQAARLAEERAVETARLAEENARTVKKLREADSRRAAAVSATANVAGRMQALSTGMLADLRAMEEKHSDEDVLTDLLHLDHRTAQAGRLADSIAVLTGARSGRRWARPISMESILRGAMGRISGYQRVRVHSASDAAVAGHAAEGVMHALAELLDNAANFSPPTAEVHLYVEQVPAGAIISVEDSGLVMGEVQLRRAERAVSGEGTELGGLTGTRLGLAVVGRLAKRYGLKISYRPSARGGTGVLMLIPQDLLVSPDGPTGSAAPGIQATPSARAVPAGRTAAAALPAASAAPELPRRGTPAPVAAAPAQDAEVSYAAALSGTDLDPDPVPTHEFPDSDDAGPAGNVDTLPHGLPRRRRGRTLAEAERARNAGHSGTPRTAPAAGDAKTRATRFGTFRQAVRHTPDQGGTGQGTPDRTAPGRTGLQGSQGVQGTTGPAADSAVPGAVPAPDPRAPESRPAADSPVPGSAPGAETFPGPDGGSATAAPSPTHPHSHPEGDTTS
ncbi:ATP-binding protein [Streptomyces sp. CRN 30]|uniref:sensor histidine kinase n=1 Tax=Streptomyces sp. CRN 30 TaxID=3075613 RepID=UPI002A7F03C9|nr:ATP-binding protein [Streptomyces sp. CRN 30]